jgi:hypothetical protein
MVVTIKKGMTPEQAQLLLSEAQREIWERKRLKKIESLKKLGGLLSHLKMDPLEIQNEMRDGWLE